MIVSARYKMVKYFSSIDSQQIKQHDTANTIIFQFIFFSE